MSELQVTVTQSPHQSVYLALREAASCRGPFSSRHVLRPLHSLVSRPDYARALHPVRRHGGGQLVPTALVPLAPVRDVPLPEQVEALHGYGGQKLMDDIATLGSDAPIWRRAVADPDRWLRTYAELIDLGWQALEQRWNLLRPAIDAETERLGVATVRGCLPSALNTISPRLTFTESGFSVDGHEPVPYDGRRLALVPGIGAPDTLFVHYQGPSVISIAYPLRDLPDVSPARPVEDPLEVVLGVPRARILRLLREPLNVGMIAADLAVTPAAATRHCDVLLRAGLIARERRGRQVLISRTTRGEKLLDVL
ncbi:ArsR/SmtB family transcription factor [Kribbella sp. NPDC058693]|uniref:ArsR/SmtB family transcription factor n=1 Tax=Kribbella sp. NPDC058693 TaxID=3346602 RepID=UPI0036614EAD